MQCCRICLGSCDLTNIFSTENTAQQILNFASVKLQENDDLPQYICLLCKHELDICANFKEKCEMTYEILIKKKAKLHLNNNVLINLIDNGEHLAKELPGLASKVFNKCVQESIEHIPAIIRKEVEGSLYSNEPAQNIESEGHVNYSTISENNSYIENCYVNLISEKSQEISLTYDCEDFEESIVNESSSSEGCWNEVHYEMVETLGDEMEVLYQENEDLTCSLCNFYFSDEEALKSHIDRIHKNTKELCQICLSEFPNHTALCIHLKKKHDITVESDAEVVKCRICYKIFFQQTDLKSHKCNSNQLAFKCMNCERSFSTEAQLKKHLQNSHASHFFSCQYCEATFHVHDKLLSHLRSHNKEYIKCDLCSKYLKNNATLKIHQKLHLQNKEYLCDKCNKKYLTKWDLRRHRKTVHNNHNHIIIVEN